MKTSPVHSNHSFSRYYLPTILIIGVILILFIAKGTAIGVETEIKHEDVMIRLVGYAVIGCELMAGLVIAISAIQSLFMYFKQLINRDLETQIRNIEEIRLRMGYKLSLALEFAVAADILRLTISPKVADVVMVFAIILLRALLIYFLEHDNAEILGRNEIHHLFIECADDPEDGD